MLWILILAVLAGVFLLSPLRLQVNTHTHTHTHHCSVMTMVRNVITDVLLCRTHRLQVLFYLSFRKNPKCYVIFSAWCWMLYWIKIFFKVQYCIQIRGSTLATPYIMNSCVWQSSICWYQLDTKWWTPIGSVTGFPFLNQIEVLTLKKGFS